MIHPIGSKPLLIGSGGTNKSPDTDKLVRNGRDMMCLADRKK